jgi:DNA-binding GntR family transcriptional regulator
VARQNSWQPVYQRIASDIRSQILSGELAADAQITTEHELAARYGVARATVRQGLMLLVQEGLIVARRPLGYFVRRVDRLDWPVFNFEHEGAADAWVESVQEQGRTPRQDIKVEIIQPDAAIAERLKLDKGELAVARRRLRFVDDVPYLIADSFYPEPIVRGSDIVRPADITGGARHVLADLGHKWVTHLDEIEGRNPTEDESHLLNIPPGLPVMVHMRTSSNADGVPSRVIISVLPVDRWRLIYRIEG